MIPQHLLATLIVALWMCLIGLAFKGWGGLLKRWIMSTHGQPSQSYAEVVTDIWLGICFCITLTELIHFVLPINGYVSAVVFGLGAVFAIQRWLITAQQPFVVRLSKLTSSGQAWLYLFACCAIGFIWIAAVMKGASNYDSGLYHFGAIKWLNEQAVTFGMVNLHTRLAYNQSYFALIALVNFHPLYEHAYAATGLFLFVLSVFSCVTLISSSIPRRLVLFATTLVLLSSFILKAASPSPDFAVAVFQVVIFFSLFRLLLESKLDMTGAAAQNSHLKQVLLLLLAALCVTAVTIKLSMALFCLGALVIAYRPTRVWLKGQPRSVLRLVVVCVAILLIHALRGVVLSGVPFYPSTFAGFWSLPYALDPAQVTAEARSIYSWARQPGIAPDIVLRSWDWLLPWASQLPARFSLLSGIALLLLAVNLILLIVNKAYRKKIRLYALYVPLCLGATFWFLTAPDPRFLGAIPELMIVFGLWLLSTGMRLPSQQNWRYLRLSALAAGLVLAVLAVLYAFKLQTGLGLSQRFYIGEVLYGLSQIDLNATFFLTLITLLILLWLQKRARGTENSLAASKFIGACHHLCTVLVLGLVITFVAQTAMFNRSNLAGWSSIPIEPYEAVSLKSGLKVHIPVSDDLCWNTPLPCQPRQQYNPNLQLRSLDGLNILLPNAQMFTVRP
ncbi:hypothetical protein MCERE10_03907 [Burkholderiaceae bacterium]